MNGEFGQLDQMHTRPTPFHCPIRSALGCSAPDGCRRVFPFRLTRKLGCHVGLGYRFARRSRRGGKTLSATDLDCDMRGQPGELSSPFASTITNYTQSFRPTECVHGSRQARSTRAVSARGWDLRGLERFSGSTESVFEYLEQWFASLPVSKKANSLLLLLHCPTR